MTRPWGRRAVAALALAAAPVLVATPARAADPVGLSRDGVGWSADLAGSLFDPALRWVPGDTEATTLYVRNQSGLPAHGYAEVTLGTPDDPPVHDLAVRTRLAGGPWDAGTTSRTVALPAGEVVALDIEVAFDPASTNATRNVAVPLTVRVVLSGEGELPGPPAAGVRGPTDVPAGGGSLASTGLDALRTAAAAATLLVAGAWLAGARRREARGG